jgi:hypothetical protein
VSASFGDEACLSVEFGGSAFQSCCIEGPIRESNVASRWRQTGASAWLVSELDELAGTPVPLTIMLAIVLRGIGIPAELKLLSVFALGVIASFGLGWLFARSRVAGRFL